MILVIDNYDSFTYNLVQYLGELGAELQVVRNDQTTVEAIEKQAPERIVISPGPKTPSEAGICLDVITAFAGRIPILGVCLGHQAIGQAFGGQVIRAPQLMHGKTSEIQHDGKTIFAGLPNPFPATRYHSLIVARETLPACLEISASHLRRAHHGAPPQGDESGRRAVSPRVNPDQRGQATLGKFPAAVAH